MPIWKTAPFLRLLLPLTAGIIVQWYIQFPLPVIFVFIGCTAVNYITFGLLPLGTRFKLQLLQGIAIQLLLIGFGLLLTWVKDIRHHESWYGNYYNSNDHLLVRINEPPVEKANSYKADGYVLSVIRNDTTIAAKGKILLYFSKDADSLSLHYGDVVLIQGNLQPIKNSGNPGAFNYQRYAAFQQTFHTLFLKNKDWILVKDKDVNRFDQFIFSARATILSALQKNIGNNKNELGIAEALLIGYTNDLDKDIVQAYSNTGVVHIIAISGMHLGLIYVVLFWLFSRLPLIKRSVFIKVIAILICLWIFSLLTGASASVLRSAVVFTCITIGIGINKKASVYNSLAASAFLLLCYNPYFLWDVGFQLSYCAVLSIILFQKPIYNWFYVKNKWLDKLWEMIAITLSAQLLTFPVCIYYFHQFPVLFLLANIVAIPLSTIILFAEIFLVLFNKVTLIGAYLGKAVWWLTALMNNFIIWINHFSFSVIDNLSASVLSTWLLYGIIIFVCAWLMGRNAKFLLKALVCTLFFVMVSAYNQYKTMQQDKMIVYNVPKYRAIDFISGNRYWFKGDAILLANALLQNFHLKPSRIYMRLNKRIDAASDGFAQNGFYQIKDKRILLIDTTLSFIPPLQKIKLDVIVISKNPKIQIPQLASVFSCDQYVADASNSLWKIEKWKKECEDLHLRFFSVPQQGAFVLDTQ
ncbi:ComEC/Rec2 family competence protein [Ferruginibacter albus]|uniref:ComEC/Rec2 family competence protein n=1 Tax=Ferruginibacter albus TaxID=2875540 RepID=UPI001CC7BEB7|nr:ComEC/Rec2 family competence protein [Ferruginibacter albus]UAY51879.1 ComEC family competence protein [Ferruginibacter albus]